MRSLGIPLLALALFTIPTAQFMIPIAQGANIKKNVDEYAGKRCNTPAKGSGIVAGYFSGVTDNPIISSDEYAGKRCSTPPHGSGIVAGFFRGWEQTPFQNRGSGLMPVERFRCFKTMNECQSWLKTMNYFYGKKTVDTSKCTKF